MSENEKLAVLAKNQMAIKDALNFLVYSLDCVLPDDIEHKINGENGVDDSLRQAFPLLF